jgi:hypothetical protein
MEIFNLIRGHFALLIDKPMTTPAQEKPFAIESVGTKEEDWQIVLKVSTGNTDKVYISDLLRVYAFVVSNGFGAKIPSQRERGMNYPNGALC